MNKSILFLLVLVSLSLFSTSSYSATVKIDVKDFLFEPGIVNINVGDTVKWENKGTVVHSTTSGTNCTSDGKWNSGLLQPSQSFEQAFNEPETFPYYCIPHCSSGMAGTIVVGNDPVMKNPVQFTGTFLFPILVTLPIADESGNRKFRTSAQKFQGIIKLITKDENFWADEEGCFIEFLGDDGTIICIKRKSLITTFNAKSMVDNFILIGIGDFSKPSRGGTKTGPVYLDTKGKFKKDGAGAVVSVSLNGKVTYGTDKESFISGNFKSTLTSSGNVLVITTQLNGNQGVLPVTTSGSGTGSLLVNLNSNSISGMVTFSGLTSNATASHIHQGAPATNRPVIIPLEGGGGGTSGVWKVPAGSFLTQDQFNALQAGQLYLDVHSENFPAGEIQGQIVLQTSY